MLRNNIKHGVEFRYFDIQFNGKEWIVWFNKEVDIKPSLANALNKAEEVKE